VWIPATLLSILSVTPVYAGLDAAVAFMEDGAEE